MKNKFKSFGHRLSLGFSGAVTIIRHPAYTVGAFVAAFLTALLIFFATNGGFYWPIFSAPLPLLDKLLLLASMTRAMFISFATIMGMLLLVVSLLQGTAIALLVYNIKSNRRVDAPTVGRTGIAMLAATLGLGCVPCGTSLLIPLATLLFSSSAVAVANIASMAILAIAGVLCLYSIYKLGYSAYGHIALENQSKSKSQTKEED